MSGKTTLPTFKGFPVPGQRPAPPSRPGGVRPPPSRTPVDGDSAPPSGWGGAGSRGNTVRPGIGTYGPGGGGHATFPGISGGGSTKVGSGGQSIADLIGKSGGGMFDGFAGGNIPDLGDFGDILEGEIGDIQDAADKHYERTLGREGEMEQGIGDLQDALGGVGDLIDPDQYGAENSAAVKHALKTEQDFADRSAADLSAAAAGIGSQMQQQMAMINGGMRPDGTPMSSQEQQEAKYRLSMGVGRQIQQTGTAIMSQYNQQRAQLGMQTSGLMMGADQMKMNASMQQAGLELNYQQLISQDRHALAAFTMQNKETIVSKFQAWLQMFQLGMTGAWSQPTHTYTGPTDQRGISTY